MVADEAAAVADDAALEAEVEASLALVVAVEADVEAEVAEVDASLAFVVAVEADEEADVAELAAAVAELAAAVAEVAALFSEVIRNDFVTTSELSTGSATFVILLLSPSNRPALFFPNLSAMSSAFS